MIEKQNQKVSQTEKARRLFFNLGKQFGNGKPVYPQGIKGKHNETLMCLVQELNFPDTQMFVGFVDEKHWVAFYVFTKCPEKYYSFEELVALELIAGKLGPAGEAQSYADSIFQHDYNETPFAKYIHVNDLLAELGTLTNMEPKETEFEKMFTSYRATFGKPELKRSYAMANVFF